MIDQWSSDRMVKRLQEFIESEASSCSMNPCCITPEYVYRMFGARVSLEEIKEAMEDVRWKKEDG